MRRIQALKNVLQGLRAATRDPSTLPSAIRTFQELIWGGDSWADALPGDSVEALKELAYDLDYYVSDPNLRCDDPSYFGDERAIEEIHTALGRVEEPGSAG